MSVGGFWVDAGDDDDDGNVPAGLLVLGGILLLQQGADGLPGDGGEAVALLVESGHDKVELLIGSPGLAIGIGGVVGVRRHCGICGVDVEFLNELCQPVECLDGVGGTIAWRAREDDCSVLRRKGRIDKMHPE